MSQALDAPIANLERGNISRLLRAELQARVAQHEERIIRRLVQAHRDGTLTEPQRIGGIAEIAALRSLLTTLDREVHKGEDAARQLYQ